MPPPPPAPDELAFDGPDDDDDRASSRRRRRDSRPRAGPPAWALILLAGGLGLLTSLGAYFLVVRPMLQRRQPGGPEAQSPAPERPAPRPQPRPAPPDQPGPGRGAKPGKTIVGWLLPRVTPKRPHVGQEIEVTVAPSVKGAVVPAERLTFRLAGEPIVPSYDARKQTFRLKAPDVAAEVCHLEVVLPADATYQGTSGSVRFEVCRLPRGTFELSTPANPLPRGKRPVVTVAWSPKASPPEGADPDFRLDGRALAADAVKPLGGGRYELLPDLAAGPHKIEASFPADGRHEAAHATLALTVAANRATVRLALPEARYVARRRARLGVTVAGEGGAKLTGPVELSRRGAERPLARATLKDGSAVFEVGAIEGATVDLEARYLGDGKTYDGASVVEKGVAVIPSATYAAFTVPERSPNETEDFTIPKADRAGSQALAGTGLDAAKAYHLALAFPADEPGAETARHTFTGAAANGGLSVSWSATHKPQLKVLKEQVSGLLRFRLEGKDGAVSLRHEWDAPAVTKELTYEKALYADARFLRKDKLAAIRRRLDGLRLLRAKGALEVHAEAPRGRAAVPLLVIHLDGDRVTR